MEPPLSESSELCSPASWTVSLHTQVDEEYTVLYGGIYCTSWIATVVLGDVDLTKEKS